ncbi:MAG: hypothetical protein Q7V53_02130, partial [Caldisericota bacterium]|nr:hypothetical protein [Caldisericota bacterium]
FRVMGGYVLSTGVLAVTLAATAFRAQQKGAAIGALVGRGRVHWLDGGCKFCDGLGLKWFLLGIALLWARS